MVIKSIVVSVTITHYQYVNVSCLHGFVLQSLLNHFDLYLLTASYMLNFLPIHVRPCSQSTVSELNGRSAFKCCTSQLVKLYRDDTYSVLGDLSTLSS